jgi:hypothetical protein
MRLWASGLNRTVKPRPNKPDKAGGYAVTMTLSPTFSKMIVKSNGRPKLLREELHP